MANLIDFVNATIKNGGASYNLWSGEINPKDGYMVAVPNRELIVKLAGYESDNDKFVLIKNWLVNFMTENGDLLSHPKMYLGTWIHEGCVYFDFSNKMEDRATAIWAGRKSNQIAIWDNENQVEIRIQANETV